MQVKTATQKKWAAILGGYRCSRQGAGIGQSPSIEMTSASGIECNFFRLMIASTLTDLAEIGRMTSFRSPMIVDDAAI